VTPVRRVRTKACDRCSETCDTLFRVQVDASEEWIFVCEPCHGEVSVDNPHFTYGGTWKSRKRH